MHTHDSTQIHERLTWEGRDHLIHHGLDAGELVRRRGFHGLGDGAHLGPVHRPHLLPEQAACVAPQEALRARAELVARLHLPFCEHLPSAVATNERVVLRRVGKLLAVGIQEAEAQGVRLKLST